MNKTNSNLTLLPDEFKKSNVLIRSKFTADLFEQKLLCVAIATVKIGENDEIVAEFTKSQLQKAIGGSRSNFYEKMKNITTSLINTMIFAEDPKKKKFSARNLIRSIDFADDGETSLIVRFNQDFRNELIEIKDNYTILSINGLNRLNTLGAFNLYQNLMSYCYYQKSYKGVRDGKFTVKYELSELRCLMGCVDISHPEFGQFFQNKGKPDYDKVIELADALAEKGYDKDGKKVFKTKFKTIKAFNRDVLSKAVEEISASTKLRVDYEAITEGRGAKVVGYIFNIFDTSYAEDVIENKKNTAEKEIELDEELQESFSYKDIQYFIKDAEGDIEKINKAFRILKSQRKEIPNSVGFMRQAIKEDFNENKSFVSDTTKKNSFSDYSQREYDFDEIERQIVNI